ncbi:MAG: DUF4838 domain-containing protein [Bacilli bacterium]|nr:DUF4838 domain-containing protein [Bacilli bacterium]
MKTNKFLALLSMFTVIPALVGCTNSSGNSNHNHGNTDIESYNDPHSGTILDEKFDHQVEGTTHSFKSKQNSTVFGKVNEFVNYKVVYNASDDNTRTTSIYLRKHLVGAFNTEIASAAPLQNSYTFNENDKIIFVGCYDTFRQAGLVEEIDVGKNGYTLKSKGNAIFILAKDIYAYYLGINRLLELVVGYDYYMDSVFTYEKTENQSTIYSYDFNDAEIPDYQYRLPAGWGNSEYVISSGCTSNPIINTSDYNWIHNAFALLGEHYYDHPEWFDETVGYRPNHPDTPIHQLCYTAHGDSESLQLMVEAGADKIISLLTSHPGKNIVSITAEDTSAYCKCPTCMTSINKYKTEAGSIIQYVNRVDKIVSSYFRNDGTYKGSVPRADLTTFPTDFDFTIFLFAYHNTVTAPTNEINGEYVPIDDSVICGEHVGVMMAPSNGRYIYSFYDERNAAVASQIKAWSKCTKRFLAYLYSDNWRGYTYPYNSFDTDVENMKFFKELNAIWMFDSCGGENPWLPGFQELKKYIVNKAMVNVNCNVSELTQKFFRNVYKDAAPRMMKMYQSERAYCLSIADVYVGNINDDNMFSGDTARARWPRGLLLEWWQMCDDAMQDLSVLEYTNPDKFKIARLGVLIESIFPRFAMLDLHQDYFEENEFKVLAKQLKDDMLELRFTHVKEHDTGILQQWFDRWGV